MGGQEPSAVTVTGWSTSTHRPSVVSTRTLTNHAPATSKPKLVDSYRPAPCPRAVSVSNERLSRTPVRMTVAPLRGVQSTPVTTTDRVAGPTWGGDGSISSATWRFASPRRSAEVQAETNAARASTMKSRTGHRDGGWGRVGMLTGVGEVMAAKVMSRDPARYEAPAWRSPESDATVPVEAVSHGVERETMAINELFL